MLSRRRFLQQTSLLAFAPVVPAFVPGLAAAAEPDRDGRVLVVVQLDGGNDGLNTVVPFADDAYHRARPTLRLTDRLHKLTDRVALHPAMRAAAELFHDGRLAVVQGVGYPNPNRSHFESMAVWQTARLAADEQRGNGWVGGALDELARPTRGGPDAVYVGDGEVPRALLGRRAAAAALSRADDLAIRLDLAGKDAGEQDGGDAEDLASFVRRQVLGAAGTARELAAAVGTEGVGAAAYPDTALARQLSLVAKLIRGGAGTRAYYVTHAGYDTHALQRDPHAELLGDLAGSVKAFMDDLKGDRLDERVLLMSFSEFGRRVAENGSRGTDHGTAGPVLLAGPAVRAGLHGVMPSLPETGDLEMTVDFRAVYATVLRDWLDIPPERALRGKFERLPLLRA